MSTRGTLAVLAAMVALTVLAPRAHADDQATCDFLEISATTKDKGSVAAELKPLEKKLKRPPFSSWNTFTLVARQSATLAQLKAATLKLSIGSATVLLREIDRAANKRPRIGLGISMDDQTGRRVLDTKVTVDAGDFLVIGRSLPNNDGHLLALTCKP